MPEPIAPPPFRGYANQLPNVREWRIGRVWQYWLMAMATLGFCSWLFGADDVGGFIWSLWSRVPFGVVSVPPA